MREVTPKRVSAIFGVAILPFAILALALTTGASEKGLHFQDSEAYQWYQTDGYDPCNPQETGRICAEWRTLTQPTGVRCCISPINLGTENVTACLAMIDGAPGLVPGRSPIDDPID
ncbi:MAG: hypothetical protein AAF725_06440 [Acidobacteriota bacterium]